MAPEFHIQTEDLPWPFIDYIEDNVPVFAPQSEYLASLDTVTKKIYDKLREQQWTEEDCYDYFVCIDKFMGFDSAWLLHKGWKEEQIQNWKQACQEIYALPGLKEKSFRDYTVQIQVALLQSIKPRTQLWEEMEATTNRKSLPDSKI